MWNGKERPAAGDEVCLAVSGGEDHVMEALRAQPDRPSGDYVLVRVKSVDGDVVHFDFPADRLYLDAEDIRKISVSELSERVRVKDPETNRVETRLKTAFRGDPREGGTGGHHRPAGERQSRENGLYHGGRSIECEICRARRGRR